MSDANASSRFGPTAPVVFASASVWQAPHVLRKSSFPWAGSPDVTRPTAPQPLARSATRTAARLRKPARSVLGGRLRGVQLRDRLVARAVDREHAVEPRDLEDLRDVAVAADERELAVVRAQPLDAADEHAERRRVDERRVGEVDDDLPAALADHLEQLLLELGRRVEVDLAGERDHVGVVGQLLGLDVEVHVSPGGLGWSRGRVYLDVDFFGAEAAACDFSCAFTAFRYWRTCGASTSFGASFRNRANADSAVFKSFAASAACPSWKSVVTSLGDSFESRWYACSAWATELW